MEDPIMADTQIFLKTIKEVQIKERLRQILSFSYMLLLNESSILLTQP